MITSNSGLGALRCSPSRAQGALWWWFRGSRLMRGPLSHSSMYMRSKGRQKAPNNKKAPHFKDDLKVTQIKENIFKSPILLLFFFTLDMSAYQWVCLSPSDGQLVPHLCRRHLNSAKWFLREVYFFASLILLSRRNKFVRTKKQMQRFAESD